jgi:hypothetical protein
MKTTVDIPDSLFAEAKAVAKRKGLTIRQLIEEGLRASIREHGRRAPHFKLQDGSFPGGEGLWEGLDWEKIRGIIYEGRGE